MFNLFFCLLFINALISLSALMTQSFSFLLAQTAYFAVKQRCLIKLLSLWVGMQLSKYII